MRAHARLAVGADQETGRTRITRLRSDPPLMLRPTDPTPLRPSPQWNLTDRSTAHVSLAAAAAGPVGGDHLALDIDVGPGAALFLRTVAATLALPDPYDRPSYSETTVRVAAGGSLIWLPGPVIAAQNCYHHTITHVDLQDGARLLAREELILGRHGEPSGTIRQHRRISRGDRPLHHQQLSIAAHAPGWDGPAVIGGHQALGSVLVVDPTRDTHRILAQSTAVAADTALMPLGDSATLITSLAPDAHTLRQRLDASLTELE